MDLDNTLRTLCPDAYGRVLGVLAHADEPLTASQVAHRAGMSARGVGRAQLRCAGGRAGRGPAALERRVDV